MIGGLVVIGLALRLSLIGNSLWGDELSTNFVIHGWGAGSLLDIVGSDQEGTPPLFFLLTSVTEGLGGVEGLRLVSLLAGLAAIPLTYLLGARTVGPSAGMVASALVALSPIQIFYASEARAYALVVFITLCASLALILALDSGRRRWWVLYVLSSAAAMYTHYTAAFVLIALAGWALITQAGSRGTVLLANVAAAALFLPWLPEFLEDSDEAAAKIIEAIHPLILENVRGDVLAWAVGSGVAPATEVPGHLVVWIIALGLVVGAAGLLLRLRRDRGGGWWRPRPEVVLVLMLALAAPVGALVQGLVSYSQFIPRNLLTSWPGYAVVVGGLVTAGRTPFRVAAVALVLGGYAAGAAQMLEVENQRPDFAGAAEFIERTGDPDSPVVDVPHPTPGPQTAMEAALAPEGEPLPPDRPVLVLMRAEFETRLRAQAPGPPEILDPLPTPSEQELAGRAARLAGSGPLFLVNPGIASLAEIRVFPGPVASFVNSLPPGFHETEARSFPGFTGLSVTVHVLSR